MSPTQVPVIAADQPTYALPKQIQEDVGLINMARPTFS